MKEFWIYTGLRVLLFLGALAVVAGIWAATAGEVPILWAVVIAFLVSGVGSYFLLARQREAFARRVEARASRASAAFEQRKAREDQD